VARRHLTYHLFHARGILHIDAQRHESAVTELGFAAGEVGCDYRGALVSHPLRDSCSDPGQAPGNDGDFSIQA
jgi:hypothetical protein